jgi:nonsense-mediated mRNA decay protein 3
VIEANASNMCINCIRNQVDITEGLPRLVHIAFCKSCGRYNQPPGQWLNATLESKELLEFCIKRIRGLNKVKLVDAAFVWTEPHSKRIKVKLTIQKEVFNGAILQQTFVVEYVVNNLFCDECHKIEAQINWNAVAQLRQRVHHKRSFYWLEQIILKHSAHREASNVVETADGIDFFFGDSRKARRFIDFIAQFAPLRWSSSKKLISFDEQNNVHKYKEAFSVELAPICRDDLICLPHRTAQRAGSLPPFVLCTRVTNSIHLIDPITLKHAEINSLNYYKDTFASLANSRQLTEFIILDIELTGVMLGKYAVADCEVTRASELGTGVTFQTRTHLGHLLNPGDSALGYDISTIVFNDEYAEQVRNSQRVADVLLVRKTYPQRTDRANTRIFKLKRLQMHTDDAGNEEVDEDRNAADYEYFLRDIEEDRDQRAEINLYADKAAMIRLARRQQEKLAMRRAAEAAGHATTMDGADDDSVADDDAFPEVEITELLEEMSLRSEQQDHGEYHGEAEHNDDDNDDGQY